MQIAFFPEVVQVVPFPDHTVSVYFSDGKIVSYDVKPLLDKGVFRALQNMEIFMNRCGIMNDTLAWDVAGNGDPTACIDIDPETLYGLDAIEDRLSVS
jgi:hypothetical protein